jgi:hypothetical protein
MVMKTFQTKWRKLGIMVFIYLDDILIIGPNPHHVTKNLAIVLGDLNLSGMVVNTEKSILQPTQNIPHLGFHIDFQKGLLQLRSGKLKNIRKEFGNLLTHSQMSCRKMAAILGQIRAFLTVMPFLRAFTDQLLNFVNLHQKMGWDVAQKIPTPLQQQVREIKDLMVSWAGRPFNSLTPLRALHSDASQFGWWGVSM